MQTHLGISLKVLWMALVKDRVIVIKGSDFSEADKILTLFGRSRGKFSVIAKGVRKFESKNRSAVQSLSIAEITYYEGQNLGVLVEAELVHSPFLEHGMLKNASKLLYIINKLLPEDDRELEIYRLIEENFINDMFELRDVNRLRMRILTKLGYLPDTEHCSICGEKCKTAGIDLATFAIICDKCMKISKSTKYTAVEHVKYESHIFDRALDVLIQELAGNIK